MPASPQVRKDPSRTDHPRELGGLVVLDGNNPLCRTFLETRLSKFDPGPESPDFEEESAEGEDRRVIRSRKADTLWESLESAVKKSGPLRLIRFRLKLRQAGMVRLVFEMEADSHGAPEVRFFPESGRFTLRKASTGMKAFSFGAFSMFPQCDLEALTSSCHLERDLEAGEHEFCAVLLIDVIDRFHLWHIHKQVDGWAFENPNKEITALLTGPPYVLQEVSHSSP